MSLKTLQSLESALQNQYYTGSKANKSTVRKPKAMTQCVQRHKTHKHHQDNNCGVYSRFKWHLFWEFKGWSISNLVQNADRMGGNHDHPSKVKTSFDNMQDLFITKSQNKKGRETSSKKKKKAGMEP